MLKVKMNVRATNHPPLIVKDSKLYNIDYVLNGFITNLNNLRFKSSLRTGRTIINKSWSCTKDPNPK